MNIDLFSNVFLSVYIAEFVQVRSALRMKVQLQPYLQYS